MSSKYFINAFFVILLSNVHCSSQSQKAQWEYITIDNQKSKWGDYDKPNWLRYFGLDIGNVNGDNFKDVVSGRWIYLNPGGDMSKPWQKIDMGINVDGILIMDIDGDKYADIIAQALPNVYWLEAINEEGTKWKAKVIGQIPATSHTNSQGFTKAQIFAGGKEEFLIAGNGNIYAFEIPVDPEHQDWDIILVASNTSDEGIGTGDIDGDGDIDITAGRRPPGEEEPLIVVWFENPGMKSGDWNSYEIGITDHPADRFAIAEINGDKKPDIIVCEERYPGAEPDGNIFWFEQPSENKKEWKRILITTQYSSNNLDIADMNSDGFMDIITSEHKGPNPQLQIWLNNGQGVFMKKIIDQGKESHLGTKVTDMDLDGDLDMVSIGWDKYEMVHLWRNDSINNAK